jgi:hypothetical protein
LIIPRMIHKWIWSSSGIILTGEKPKSRRKTCPSAHSVHHRSHIDWLGTNLGLRDEKPTTENARQHVASPECKPLVKQPSLPHAHYTRTEYNWTTLAACYVWPWATVLPGFSSVSNHAKKILQHSGYSLNFPCNIHIVYHVHHVPLTGQFDKITTILLVNCCKFGHGLQLRAQSCTSDLRVQRIINFCVHKVTCSLYRLC